MRPLRKSLASPLTLVSSRKPYAEHTLVVIEEEKSKRSSNSNMFPKSAALSTKEVAAARHVSEIDVNIVARLEGGLVLGHGARG